MVTVENQNLFFFQQSAPWHAEPKIPANFNQFKCKISPNEVLIKTHFFYQFDTHFV